MIGTARNCTIGAADRTNRQSGKPVQVAMKSRWRLPGRLYTKSPITKVKHLIGYFFLAVMGETNTPQKLPFSQTGTFRVESIGCL